MPFLTKVGSKEWNGDGKSHVFREALILTPQIYSFKHMTDAVARKGVHIVGLTSASEHRRLRVFRGRKNVFCIIPYEMLEALEWPKFPTFYSMFCEFAEAISKFGDFATERVLSWRDRLG